MIINEEKVVEVDMSLQALAKEDKHLKAKKGFRVQQAPASDKASVQMK
jgi:ABC-type uncharacterized transport system auxiliary subunit